MRIIATFHDVYSYMDAHYAHQGGLNLFVQFAFATHYVSISGQLLKEKYYSKISAASSLLTTWLLCQAHKRQDKKLLVITCKNFVI